MVLSRRQFVHLASTAALSLAGTGPARLSAAGPVPHSATESGPLSLGFSLYGMRSLPVDRAIAACAAIGYGNVELSLIAGFETAPAELTPRKQAEVRAALIQSQIRASALLAKLDLAANDDDFRAQLGELRRSATFARELDPSDPPPVQATLGGTSAAWEVLRTPFVGRLRECARVVADAGGSLAIKAHVFHAVNTPERLVNLLEDSHHPALGVAYDQAHFSLAGISAEHGIATLAGRIRYVHIKDAIRTAEGVRFLLPGQGQTDFRALFRLLVQSGYRGPVVAEVSQQLWSAPGYDPLAAARACRDALAPALPEGPIPVT